MPTRRSGVSSSTGLAPVVLLARARDVGPSRDGVCPQLAGQHSTCLRSDDRVAEWVLPARLAVSARLAGIGKHVPIARCPLRALPHSSRYVPIRGLPDPLAATCNCVTCCVAPEQPRVLREVFDLPGLGYSRRGATAATATVPHVGPGACMVSLVGRDRTMMS
jgi:hypothetical protein